MPLIFTVTRDISSEIVNPLTVNFTVSGSAINNTDYYLTGAAMISSSTGYTVIPANSLSVDIGVVLTADWTGESNETIILTLIPNSSVYLTGTNPSATVTILDDDSTPVTFTYVSGGDTNGIIYWLGSLKNTEAFINPVSRPANPLATVSNANCLLRTLSSDAAIAANPNLLTDRTIAIANDFSTNAAANSWVVFDLRSPRKLSVSQYTIRARNDNTHLLRNWKLQGSLSVGMTIAGVNGATWTDLDVRVSNTTINTPSAYYTFTPNTSLDSFRFFRLIQTGVNSSGGTFLTLSEIEFYGTFS